MLQRFIHDMIHMTEGEKLIYTNCSQLKDSLATTSLIVMLTENLFLNLLRWQDAGIVSLLRFQNRWTPGQFAGALYGVGKYFEP